MIDFKSVVQVRADTDAVYRLHQFERITEASSFLRELRTEYGTLSSWGIIPRDFRVGSVFIDFDATFIKEESLLEMSKMIGCEDQVRQITQRAMAGEMDFQEALHSRLELFAGQSQGIIGRTIENLSFQEGIEDVCKRLRTAGVPVYVISGGFLEVIEPFLAHINLTGICANRLEVQNGTFTGKITGRVVDADCKRDFYLDTLAQEGLNPSNSVVIGDGANDKPVLEKAGIAVGFQPQEILLEVIDICVAQGDHRWWLDFIQQGHL
jgi:phosphoserine phosphatase